MKYNSLIEKTTKTTFADKVKPFLNKGETYYKAKTTEDDDIEPNKVIGFGFRCSLNSFLNDIWAWCNNNNYGHPDILIFEKQLQPDGTSKAINVIEF